MEQPNKRGANNFIVGLFVLLGLLVGGGFVVFMGGSATLGGEEHYRMLFKDVRGLNVGAPVYLQGIQVGRVAKFEFPTEALPQEGDGNAIVTVISVYKQHKDRVKSDSEASITTQGVLGDKVVVLSPGTPQAPPQDPKAFMHAQQPKEISEVLAKGGNLVETLTELAHNVNLLVGELSENGRMKTTVANLEKTSASLSIIAQNLAQGKGALGGMIQGGEKDDLGPALKSLRKILDKIDKGQGTLGALVNDSSLHEDMRLLLGGAKRSTMVRFLIRQAISAGEQKEGAAPAAPKPAKK